MRNPTRRNRNIGTSKQGHGQDNRMKIRYPKDDNKVYFEELGNYTVEEHIIHDQNFQFVIEETRAGIEHACSVADLVYLLSHVPAEHYKGLNLIVLRQPKRKEEILNPVWGRLIYSYHFEDDYHPAIVLEATDLTKPSKRAKRLKPDELKEVERLKQDGHLMTSTKRYFVFEHSLEAVRNTQLYRTTLHEIGHYKEYLEKVGLDMGETEEEYEAWLKKYDAYFQIPSKEKEDYAHHYADMMKAQLEEQGLIPFERKDMI